MSDTIFKSTLWLNTLSETSQYASQHAEQVDILRVSLKDMRSKAAEIANDITPSQKGFTLHDITHLDSLWETASVVGGVALELNPLEAYVFGCAVLFHDLGMSLITWEQDLEKLKESGAFKDIVFDLLQKQLNRKPLKSEITDAPKSLIDSAVSIRLRELHAFRAADLPMMSWSFGGHLIYLIENADLRQKLSETIGQIAESHWWTVEEIRNNFSHRITSPAPTGFPKEWKISNVKLACLLRLADFIHIDDRRSPSFNFAYTRPTGVAELHWTFQNKLNRGWVDDERLVITSHSKFNLSENQAWWLAFSTANEIDKELKSVDNLLIDFGLQRFSSRGVKGVESPGLFSNYVLTENWEPADTQFKISDLRNLIEKLGGSELYGNRKIVFLRELIQNACDAIKAKRFYSKEFEGTVKVCYSQLSDGEIMFEIIDNGIGMSKSALLHGLLDFGSSYWKTSSFRAEHAGLISSGFSPTGDFGIGFFSVFMVSKKVKVITKSIIDGAQTIVLEFSSGLSSNPIFRKALRDEERIESGTTVQIFADDKSILGKMYKEIAELSDVTVENPLSYICRRLAPAISENLTTRYLDQESEMLVRADDWMKIPAIELLNRLSGFAPDYREGWNFERLAFISDFVRPIMDGEKIVGRATIVKKLPSNNNYSGSGVVTVGGLRQNSFSRFPGIWLGLNHTATRNTAEPICDLRTLTSWLEEQYDLVSSSSGLSHAEKIDLSGFFLSLGINCPALPFAKTSTGWKSFDELSTATYQDHILLVADFRNEYKDLHLEAGVILTQYGVNMIGLDRDSFRSQDLWEEELRELKGPFPEDNNNVSHRSPFGYAVLAICKAWNMPIEEVLQESILSISEWKPIVTVAFNEYNEPIKSPAFVLINPQRTSKKKIYKKYETEIKRWIGNSGDETFNFND